AVAPAARQNTSSRVGAPTRRLGSSTPNQRGMPGGTMQEATALLSDPMQVFGFLAGLIALVFWLSEVPRFRKLFEVLPPVLFAYFLPTLATTFGITPAESPAYDWMRAYLLPVALFLLMITFDLRAIIRLGRVALIMMFTG